MPVIKPGKENSDDVSKFRPISLINVGGKILKKVLINRINYHAKFHGFFQYPAIRGFAPKRYH